MDYFSKLLRSGGQMPSKTTHDHALEFHKSWNLIKDTLQHPDERQLSKGIKSTDVPAHLQSMVDSLVWESSRIEEGATGACLEYLLKNDVLGILVKLSVSDRPSGIQAEVLRAVQNMVILLDEQFLVHSAVHRAVLRLLRNCVGDDIQEQLDNRNKVMGAAKDAVRVQPSEYELDLVNLLCILCSRIRTYRELLMIFFHDKHWFRSEPLFAVEEEGDEDEEIDDAQQPPDDISRRSPSPTPSQATITSAPTSSQVRQPEYEFLLFNYLLRFVHREGQIGDFARAGLLFLMDVAMSPGQPIHRLLGDEQTGPTSISASVSGPGDPIMDAAIALAEYIIDGDFSEVLAAGLGAVYSLLPSKLEIRPQISPAASQTGGMVLGGIGSESEEEKEQLEFTREKNRAQGLEDASNPDFKFRLDHFLKLLEFLQDILRRNVVHDSASTDASANVGSAIVQSILDAVRRIFLENVLYPSILECSDADGSAVAVMSYIDIMIRTLEDGPLADLLVNFLVSEDNDEATRPPHQRQRTLNLSTDAPFQRHSPLMDKQNKLRKRKSSAMALLEIEAPDSRRPSEYFTSMGRFTLKDLLLSNFRSQNQSTATAALQLFQAVLERNCPVTVEQLLLVTYDPKATIFPEPAFLPPPLDEGQSLMEDNNDDDDDDDDDDNFIYPGLENSGKAFSDISVALSGPVFAQPNTTYSTHEREMTLYLALVSRVDPLHDADAFSTGYDHYLRDALFSLQGHSCFYSDIDEESRTKLKHRLIINDPILSLVLESLQKLFSNTPQFNISLTGVLASLALCPDRSIAGWLTCIPDDTYVAKQAAENHIQFNEDGDDKSIDEGLSTDSSLPATSLDDRSRPILFTIFQGLVGQLERYRQMVDDFDKYLSERRQGLLFSENLTDALTLVLEPIADSNSTSRTTATTSGSAAAVPGTPPRPQAKSKTTPSFMSFLTPKKNKVSHSKANSSSQPTTPPRGSNNNIAASPFGAHYEVTRDITVEPLIASLPASGLWMPATQNTWDEEDVFAAQDQWGDQDQSTPGSQKKNERPATVTLSHLLDNVVILEESIKELAAIIHARRSLGIDAIRYL